MLEQLCSYTSAISEGGHLNHLRDHLPGGSYRPQAVRGVEIPKPQGGKRLLGIPTVVDRLIQQAIHQALSGMYERTFSENSYGFRVGVLMGH